MSTPVEHDTTCQECGVPVPAGTPQKFWMGPGPRCVPCDEKALEAYGNFRRRKVRLEEERDQREAQEPFHGSDTNSVVSPESGLEQQ